MEGKEILRLVDTLHRSKEIEEEAIFQAIEGALQIAARKHFGEHEDIVVEIDRATGDIAAVRGENRIAPEALGRIAAQTAKQIILQKIREAESDTLFDEYEGRIGALITGAVQRFEGKTIVVNLGRTEAILPRSEQIPGEHFMVGERVRAVIVDVRKVGGLVKIILSRASTDLLCRLFELEVPEIAEGVVKIRKLAREPGLRTKIAVESMDARVDCIGACVGVRGTRIKSVIDQVRGEKIDIIPWSDAPETMISSCLRPAEILQIVFEEAEGYSRAVVTVPSDQLSLAIGGKGQNVRLAVKMTGWGIDLEPPELPAPPEPEPTTADEAPAEPAADEAVAEPVADEAAAEPVADEVPDEVAADEIAEDEVVDEVAADEAPVPDVEPDVEPPEPIADSDETAEPEGPADEPADEPTDEPSEGEAEAAPQDAEEAT